jgi:hypothetical protein
MINCLWFSPKVIKNNAEISIYNSTGQNPGDIYDVPRANGGTCYAMPLMLAYNQFSGNPALVSYNAGQAPPGDAGGLGRKGAQKMVILETDGAPNTTAGASFTNAGPYRSYYNVRYNGANPGGSEYPAVGSYGDNDPAVTSEIFAISQQIGPVFDTSSPGRAAALQTLQQIQYIGNTQPSPSTPLPDYKIVSGADASVVNDLRTAIANIMQSEVPVSLIR